MQFPNQLSLMLQCLNVDMAKGGDSLSVPRISKALESCSGCADVQKCRGWLRGDIHTPLYQTFCMNAQWLDTLPRLGPPQKVTLDKIQVKFVQRPEKRPEAELSPLQRQFLEQLGMSGDIAMMTGDKTTTLWRTVDECRKKGWVSLKEISPGVSRLRLTTALG